MIDGIFADNKTIGTEVIKKYPSSSQLEIQLMVVDPDTYISELMFEDHISRIIVPFEVETGLPEVIYKVKNHNKQVALSLNPSTPVPSIIHLLDDIDMLLLLAVEPGFSGQKFQEKVIEKVKEAKTLSPNLAIEVDGGVGFENTAKLVKAGADFLAANSVLYKADDFKIAFDKLEKLAKAGSN